MYFMTHLEGATSRIYFWTQLGGTVTYLFEHNWENQSFIFPGPSKVGLFIHPSPSRGRLIVHYNRVHLQAGLVACVFQDTSGEPIRTFGEIAANSKQLSSWHHCLFRNEALCGWAVIVTWDHLINRKLWQLIIWESNVQRHLLCWVKVGNSLHLENWSGYQPGMGST